MRIAALAVLPFAECAAALAAYVRNPVSGAPGDRGQPPAEKSARARGVAGAGLRPRRQRRRRPPRVVISCRTSETGAGRATRTRCRTVREPVATTMTVRVLKISHNLLQTLAAQSLRI